MNCLETLKLKGLKLTPQRRLIVDIIHNSETHLTAEDITSWHTWPGWRQTLFEGLRFLDF